jgi:ribosomal protein S18 acetylase RimI-like enzyme
MKSSSVAFSFRPSTAQDYAWLWALKRLTMRPYVEQMWSGWDDDAQEEFFRANFNPATIRVIVVDGRDVGLLHVEREPAEIFLANIQLLPEFQNRGLGSAVVRSVLADAEAHRLPVRLQVLKSNRAARRLYERLGFQLTGETSTHYLLRARPAENHFHS